MEYFGWLEQEAELTDAALTVRVQALPPNDTGRLFWDVFFTQKSVDSVVLHDINGTIDFRPVADRREWNARGRLVSIQTTDLSEIEMVPIESYFKVGEREMQRLMERVLDNQALFQRIIRDSIPDRTDSLAVANLRRMEIDAFGAWAKGSIAAMNPTDGTVVTVSYGFDASRYTTAGTAWNNGAVNAYDEFIAWVESGIDATGGTIGAIMRRATFVEIQKDAPQGINAMTLTRQQLADRISQDLGIDFRFFIFEQRLDKYDDGGLTTTRTNVWPAQKVALIPVGTAVGEMQFAPVGRAFSLARVNPDAQIDVRGQVVFKEVAGNGRELTVECQVNAFPVPLEANLWVIDAGV